MTRSPSKYIRSVSKPAVASSPRAPDWLRIFVVVGMLWGAISLLASIIFEPTPHNFTLFTAIICSGLYTVLLYRLRSYWLPKLQAKPLRNAALLGIFNAAIVETIFWLAEKIFGAQGVAAHPNLLLDLLLTLPWYIGLILLFVRTQDRQRFSPWVLLLLAGVYELAADGIIGGQLMPLILGESVDLLQSWFFLILLAFWQFIPTYSSLLLPPAWVVESLPPVENRKRTHPVRDAVMPLLWMLPYFVFLILAMYAILMIGNPSA